MVVHVLIFSYEKQVAFVKWGNAKSRSFGITNGSKQGAVLSPPCFAVYLDDLLKELRNLKLGCYIAGTWVGATAYADDLVLLAPTRSSMKEMLRVCERYALDHNISFSTDENPTKSKTKIVYMCGNMKSRAYPAPLKLNGRNLPFVPTAVHLGHTLAQDGTMDHDIKIRRCNYIDKTTEI